MAEGLPMNGCKISWNSLQTVIFPERVAIILLADPSVCGQIFKVNSNSKWKLAKADKQLAISENKIEHINTEIREENKYRNQGRKIFYAKQKKPTNTNIVSTWVLVLCQA